MLTVADLRRAHTADDAELTAARTEYDRALAAVKRTCECCGQYKPMAVFFDPDVRAAGDRIGRSLRRLMNG